MFFNIIRFNKIINSQEKLKLLLFVPFTIILFFVEMIGLGFIVPIVSVLINGDPFSNFLEVNFIKEIAEIYYEITLDINKEKIIQYFIILYVIIFIIKNIYILFYNWLAFSFSNSVQKRLSTKLLIKYLNLGYIDFINRHSSIFFNNIFTETSKIRNLITNLIYLFSEIIIFVGITLLIFSFDFESSFLGIALICISSLFYYLSFKKKAETLGYERYDIHKSLVKNILQSINGYKLINIYNKQKFFTNFHEKVIGKYLKVNKSLSILSILPKLWIEIFSILAISIVILIMKEKNDTQNIIPFLSLLVVAMIRVIPSINKIILALQSLKSSKVTLDVILSDLNINEKEITKDDSENNIEFNKEIKIANLKYKFPSRRENVLDGVNLTFSKGKSYAIKGESGSGKTTLLNIIMGILSPNTGEIYVDNIQKNLNSKKWKSKIGYVSQDTFLFDDTILRNITLDFINDANHKKKVLEVLKIVELEHFINSLPNGVDTVVGERGLKISGGQKQRLGIARALFTDPKILVFDEPTSSLDENNSIQIFKFLISLKEDKTVLVVSHKLYFENEFDKIFQIKNGQLV
jgi:ATP-binding cassette, subfamily B, bacterial PglK